MAKLSSFPHLSTHEFEEACTTLYQTYLDDASLQSQWLSIEIISQHSTKFLRVIKSLPVTHSSSPTTPPQPEENEIEEDDDEVLPGTRTAEPVVNYDIVLSPTYRVPALYFSIKDPLFRYPLTMDTLYQHLVTPQFRAQAEGVGVMGGITITDHPVTNMPVFFIHPCQTAAVMEASVGGREVEPGDYLMVWIGALGKCVGLDVPMALATSMRRENDA